MHCQNCGQEVKEPNEHTKEIGGYTVFTCKSDSEFAQHFGPIDKEK